jgi:hypothetical protein
VLITLTARDSQGQTASVTRAVQPNRIQLQFETAPTGLRLSVAGEPITPPTALTVWPGWVMQLAAAAQQTDTSGLSWTFQSWSDGGAATHNLTAPAAPATYRATYRTTANLFLRVFLPLLMR